MNNKYKLIFDKIKEENIDNYLNNLTEIEEIRELAAIVIEINSSEQIQTFTTS